MPDHLIIGGGINGMLTARELLLAGAEVTLLERTTTGQESSWAGGGIVSPLYPWRYPPSVTRLARWSQAHYPDLISALGTHTGIDPEWQPSGLLMISPEEEATAVAWGEESGSQVELIDTAKIHHWEPALAEPPARAIWMPEVGQVRNPRLVKALRREIERLGASVREQHEVRQIVTHHDRVSGALTDHGLITAASIIVCAGAWSGELLKQFPTPPAVEPVKGQMILFKGLPGMISRITLEQDRYIIPRRDGRILFGSTLERTRFDKFTTDEARSELIEIACQRFPLLKNLPIEHHWAGLRPGTPGGVPYIARHPAIEGLYLNAGQYRNGVVLGPASARLMADIILQRDSICPLLPYQFNRDSKESGD